MADKDLNRIRRNMIDPDLVQEVETTTNKIGILNGEVNTVKTQLAEKASKADLTKIFIPSKNLFDKSKATPEMRISVTGGTQSQAGYSIGYVKVKAGQAYTFERARHYALYDNSMTYVQDSFYDNKASGQPALTVVPSSDGYIGFTIGNSYLETFQVEKGNVKTPYEEYREKITISEEQIIFNPPPFITPIKKKSIELIKKGNSLNIISDFDGTKKISVNVTTKGSKNGAFNFESVVVGGINVHSNTDDITPVRIWNGMAIGANHGYTCIVSITSANHGKTTVDLGSRWTDGNTTYTLLKIEGDVLYFGCPYTTEDGMTIATSITPVANLTHVSGATNKTTVSIAIINTSTALTQLFPSINNLSTTVELDGVKITEDGTYQGNSLVIKEDYNIMDYKSLLDYAQNNIGRTYANDSIEGLLRHGTTYTFKSALDCLVSTTVKPFKKVRMGTIGVIQSLIMSANGYKVVRYMPNVLPKSGVDFSLGVDMSNYSTTIRFMSSDFLDGKIPNRFVDWLVNSSTNNKFIGFTMGYMPDKSQAKDGDRLANLGDSYTWDMRNSKKSYPIARQAETLDVGDYRSYQAYRKYLVPTNATNINILQDGADTYIILDYHINVKGVSLLLPSELIGKKIEIVDSKSFVLLNEVVDSSGVTFNISGDYGYAILKV